MPRPIGFSRKTQRMLDQLAATDPAEAAAEAPAAEAPAEAPAAEAPAEAPAAEAPDDDHDLRQIEAITVPTWLVDDISVMVDGVRRFDQLDHRAAVMMVAAALGYYQANPDRARSKIDPRSVILMLEGERELTNGQVALVIGLLHLTCPAVGVVLDARVLRFIADQLDLLATPSGVESCADLARAHIDQLGVGVMFDAAVSTLGSLYRLTNPAAAGPDLPRAEPAYLRPVDDLPMGPDTDTTRPA